VRFVRFVRFVKFVRFVRFERRRQGDGLKRPSPFFCSTQYVVSGFRLRAEGASARLAVALAEAVSRTVLP